MPVPYDVTTQTPKAVNIVRKSIVSIGILFSLVVLYSCGGRVPNRRFMRGADFNQATSVEVTPVKDSSISREVVNYGTIRSSDVVNVTPQVGNRITHVYAHIGDTVKTGDILAKIYDKTYRDQLAQNKAQLAQARSNLYRDSLQYTREQKLYKKSLVSDSEFESAQATYLNDKAQYTSAQAAFEQSKQNLDYTDIRSPVYGVVTQRNISVGNVVTQNKVVYQINNLLGLESYLYLPRDDWKQVAVGQKATFYINEGGEKVAEGIVTRKSPQLDPSTGLGKVVVSLDKAGNSVSPGLLCKTVINVETHRHTIVVPNDALIENVQTFIDPESNTIQLHHTYTAYVVKHDTMAVRRRVKLGIQQGNNVEVISGLSAGDKLIITGQNGLQDSAKVQIVHPGSFGSSGPKPGPTAESRSSSSNGSEK